MIWLAYIAVVFVIVQLVVAGINLVARQSFPEPGKAPSPLVSVLIPARNEAHNLPDLLSSLQKQVYDPVEVIVFDDQSTDGTAGVVERFAAADPRIRLIRSGGLPEGWLGKNYACHSLAASARGAYLLFLDADVRINSRLIVSTVAFSQRYRTGLLSIFPQQLMVTPGEWATVPVMNFILLTLLPLILVRRSRYPSLSAANGQFMLFERELYLMHQPHERMKANKVEDIEIARYYKEQGIPVACLAGNGEITCRMYQGFREAVNGFSKNVVCFFGNSYLLAILFWVITTFGFIPVFAAMGMNVGLAYVAMVLLVRTFVSIVSRQSVLRNLVFLPVHQLVLGYFIYSAFMLKKSKKQQWKGRYISHMLI